MLEKIRLFSNRQKLGLLILGFIILALPLLILTLQRATEYRQRAAEATMPFFVLGTQSEKKSMGENFDVKLMLTNPATVIGIDTTVTFDSQSLDLVAFQPQADSPLNSVLLKTIDNQKGTLRYAAGNMTSTPTSESLGILTFRAKKDGITTVAFQNAKLVLQGQSSALTPTNNVPGIYTIGENTAATTSASLTLVPSTATASLGKPFTVDVYLNAGTNKITGVGFTLAHNELPLKSVDTTANPFNNLLKNTQGDDSYQFAAVDTIGKEITGTIKLATLTFSPEKSGANIPVAFSGVQVTALGAIGSIANATFPNAGKYNVEGVPTPTTTLTGSCQTLYGKIQVSFNTTCQNNDPKYDPVADLNKDKGVNGQDYSLFLKDTTNGTDQGSCANYLANTINPCTASTTPTQPTLTNTPTPSIATPTSGVIIGDANGDNIVDILDYNIWRDEYLGKLTTKTSDFNKDSKIDLIDFSIWRNAFNP